MHKYFSTRNLEGHEVVIPCRERADAVHARAVSVTGLRRILLDITEEKKRGRDADYGNKKSGNVYL